MNTFKSLEADENIYSNIVGEGMFDNAFCIILFQYKFKNYYYKLVIYNKIQELS